MNGSGAPVKDKRTAVDVVIVREPLERMTTVLRWAPTNCQLADGLTKDEARPVDLLCAVVREGEYQLFDEADHLRRAAAERQRRQERGKQAEALAKAGTAMA